MKIKFMLCFLLLPWCTSAQTSGGPDLFGYTWFNSDDVNGPVYNWIDINSLPGTVTVAGLADDNMVGPFSMQIPFEYYGYQPPQFWIGSNGYMAFTASMMAHPFPMIPNPSFQQNFIAVMASDFTFHDNLSQPVPGAVCKYWFSPDNDTLIVTWQDVPFWNPTAPGYSGLNTTQVILSAVDYSITFQYFLQSGTVSNTPNFLTTGIENNTGLSGLQSLYDNYPLSGTAVRFAVEEHNLITGKLFIDLNSNSVQDANENSLPNRMILEQNTGRMVLSISNGTYGVPVFTPGSYITSPLGSINYFAPVPPTHSASFTGLNQIDSLNDFAYQPSIIANDLWVQLYSITPFRPGFPAQYQIYYKNVGTTSLSGTIMFFPDSILTYDSSSVIPTMITTDSIVYTTPVLLPFQTGIININVTVDSAAVLGNTVVSSARIEPVAGDYDPSNNYASWEEFVTGSFDPNDIRVNRDTVFTNELPSPPYLEYLIRFQNTGNDTAFNVKVMNNISVRLNIATFELIETSHPCEATYLHLSRDMKFKFDNILLPDSNINEPASHGFIRYRIKPLSNLVAGNQIKNNAAIYFDFNQPVLTDTAITTIALPTGINQPDIQSSWCIIYPSPSRDKITIYSSKTPAVKIEVCNMMGQRVFQTETTDHKSQIAIDVSEWSPGIYFVNVSNRENTVVKKIVIE